MKKKLSGKDSAPNDCFILGQLEALADRLGLPIRAERIPDEETVPVAGGLCRIEGKPVIIINAGSTLKEKIRILARALAHFDLNDVYVLPAVRAAIEEELEAGRLRG